jgi:hypothetical protein
MNGPLVERRHEIYSRFHPIEFDSFIKSAGCSMQAMQTSRSVSGPDEGCDIAQCHRLVVCLFWRAVQAVDLCKNRMLLLA